MFLYKAEVSITVGKGKCILWNKLGIFLAIERGWNYISNPLICGGKKIHFQNEKIQQ
jgi:hypothetical protein